MTLPEFKAWFEGFTETMDGPPSLKQWERIQARVKEITGNPITERVYIDRYRDYLWNYVPPRYPYYTAYGIGQSQNISNSIPVNGLSNATQNAGFDSHSAMAALGRNEARSIAS